MHKGSSTFSPSVKVLWMSFFLRKENGFFKGNYISSLRTVSQFGEWYHLAIWVSYFLYFLWIHHCGHFPPGFLIPTNPSPVVDTCWGTYMHLRKCKISLLAIYKLPWCYRWGQLKHKTGVMFISKLLEIDQRGQREWNWKKTAMG